MRTKTDKKHYTKPERIFAEILKRNKVDFKGKVKVAGHEVDFLIKNIAVEIGNHPQDISKNRKMIEAGFSTLFVTNQDLYNHPVTVERHLLTYWLKK